MNLKLIVCAFTACVLGFTNCKTQLITQSPASPPDTHNSRNSLDWEGVYRGVLPCADCEGIETVLFLHKNQIYRLQTRSKGKKPAVSETKGAFTWNDQGNTITLDTKNKAGNNRYFVGENQLMQLDKQGNRITGDLAEKYILKKELAGLEEKYWKLTHLYGKPVVTEKRGREPYLTLHKDGSKVSGNGGCNSFFGTYALEDANRIRFSGLGGTAMACEPMETETQLFKVLQATDSYLLKGDTLFLHKARMAPLAKFEAVYLR